MSDWHCTRQNYSTIKFHFELNQYSINDELTEQFKYELSRKKLWSVQQIWARGS